MDAPAGIELDFTHTDTVDLTALHTEARRARETLESKTGPGSASTGWLDLPMRISDSELAQLEQIAKDISRCDALVVIGVGGSHLGARAVIEALADRRTNSLPIHFTGHHFDATEYAALLNRLMDGRYTINLVSKSGTTTESGVAFRLFYRDLAQRFGTPAADRLVVAITDPTRGPLRRLARDHEWVTFPLPEDVGGRYSVLTAVGLLPAAAAGLDLRSLVEGAREMMQALRAPAADLPSNNAALAYAAFRQAAYRAGKRAEALLTCSPRLASFAGWWQQLFGESEGKEGRGLLPISVQLTTDLHSLGQWLQQGERIALETAIDVVQGDDLTIPVSDHDDGWIDRIAGREIHEINRSVLAATLEAHAAAEAPCLRIVVPEISEKTLGALLYFFEYACAVSGYMMNINPFDQPGVDVYKRNLQRLLDESDK